jgi:anti-anti-sigma factor
MERTPLDSQEIPVWRRQQTGFGPSERTHGKMDILFSVSYPSPDFAVRAEPDGDGLILYLQGELDLASIGIADAAIAEAAGKAYEEVIFDCSELTFLDSSGIRTLLAARERWGGRVAVINPHRIVEKALAVTGLVEVLNVVDTLDEAREILHR